ncbi:hypothetical protein, partial [uncultured Adlercreutzia sp.]|uniref:hypothetical protein n=1 Tax=uncultured Adlercreutzia sp. TaxID=875803 RepID=UPI0025A5EB58
MQRPEQVKLPLSHKDVTGNFSDRVTKSRVCVIGGGKPRFNVGKHGLEAGSLEIRPGSAFPIIPCK